MGAAVSLTLSANDKLSRKLDWINNKIASLQAPVRHAQRSLKRFFDITGVTRMRKGMADLSRSTLGAFRSVGRLVPEMGILTSASSIAGVYKLSSAWATFGTNLRTTARSIGMNPSRLMALRNAARLSGGSADAMSSALGQISTQKWEAVNGFAPEAAAQFQALGISMKELKQLSPDQIFARIAARIRSLKTPAAQTIAATKLFGEAGASLLPIFQQTGRAFQDNIRLAKRYGVMNEEGADAAAKLQKSQQELSMSVEGFGYSIAQTLAPVITPVLHQMAEWIAANREWIAQDLAGYVKRVVQWLQVGGWDKIKSQISGVMHRIKDVVDYLGGWKAAAKDAFIGIAVLWAAPVISGIASLTLGLLGVSKAVGGIIAKRGGLSRVLTLITAFQAWKTLQQGTTPDQQAANRDWIENLPGVSQIESGYAWMFRKVYGYDPPGYGSSAQDQLRGGNLVGYLRQNNPMGINDNAIIGTAAAGVAESHLDPNAANPDSSARGAYQFLQGTRDEILNEQGVDVWGADVPTQTQAALAYYKKHYPSQFARFATSRSPEEAMSRFTTDFLRPGDGTLGDIQRGRGFISGFQADIAPKSASPQGQSPYDKMLLDLHISAKTPAGTTVKATSRSDNLHVASVKQQRAMDPENSSIGN
ncbi:phage tail tip lysozyme [Acetobacter oryzifermentans]|uniref:phage tail tip lysozyme n=1 Tax=Acetobacter oryzifermentans TaxID=1633874 RepID=UPI0007B0A3FD|nr:phage tail tip lysozyme [Acetobacter oryzifermentans]